MSDKQTINSKLKKNNKEKIGSNGGSFPQHINQSKNEKLNNKNMNLKSKTPIKTDKAKDSNKINNNKNIIIPPNSNNYNINNNISININISMSNNDSLNKRHKSISGTQNKSVAKKKPISIKKEELKNPQNLIMKSSIIKSNNNNYYNSTTKTKKNKSIHESLHSANYSSKDNRINKTNKQNFNLTTTGFYPKKKEKNKNVSLDNIKITESMNKNENKKDFTIAIATVHKNNKKIIDKNIRLKKKTEKKRNNFSPAVNREILNIKQNEILNYSQENRKLPNQKDDNFKTIKEKNNFKDLANSPVRKRKVVKNRAKSISSNSNEFNLNLIDDNANTKNKNHVYENEKKQIINYKNKPLVSNKINNELKNKNNNANNSNNTNNNKSEIKIKEGNKTKYNFNSPIENNN